MIEFLAKFLIFSQLISFLIGLLLRFAINGDLKTSIVSWFTTTAIFSSCIASVFLCYCFVFNGASEVEIILFKWISILNYDAYFSIFLSKFTTLMLCLVTIVSFLVHLYSISYMKEEGEYSRFMINISFFTFCMSSLVTSSNFLQMFFGWEGVGVSSYLLINYYNKKTVANLAAMKAFFVNRFADIFMLLAFGLIFVHTKSLDFEVIKSSVYSLRSIAIFENFNALDLIAISLFLGCMGKSAQFLFHIWLPDAMQGPTPISALMHAATMVTAGVFLICKTHFVFENSPITCEIILLIGALTTIFSALIAVTQTDIKKIIAYSTCSQLGYMFIAAGIGFYSGAFFHLLSHGFFKSLLFLCAGGVIVGTHHNQDIFKMPANLYKKMPITFASMLIGTFAICGFPFLSGFYSKEPIIEAVEKSDLFFSFFAFFIANIAVFLTSFYSFRVLFLTFFSKNKSDHEPHEVCCIMKFVFFILSIFAIYFGYFAFQEMDIIGNSSKIFDSNANLNFLSHENLSHEHSVLNIQFFASFAGLVFAFISYLAAGGKFSIFLKEHLSFLHKLSLNKMYFDEIYTVVFVKNYKFIANFFVEFIDFLIVNNFFVSKPSFAINRFSSLSSCMQNGKISTYALLSFVFIILVIFVII